jgi:hypothetical protein
MPWLAHIDVHQGYSTNRRIIPKWLKNANNNHYLKPVASFNGLYW